MIPASPPFILCILLTAIASGFAQGQPRKCVAFCVGIEQFADPSVNTLRYVAEDTFAVWKQIKEITALDEARSQLIVVDREKTDRELPGPEHLRSELLRAELTEAFQNFLFKVTPEDLVII